MKSPSTSGRLVTNHALLPRNSHIRNLVLDQLPSLLFIVFVQRLYESRLHVVYVPSRFLRQRLMPPPAHRVPGLEEPRRHLLGALPPPMRRHVLRLHVLPPGRFEVLLDLTLVRSRPFRVRDEGHFEIRVELPAGFGPRAGDAGMGRVDPGDDADYAARGGDAVEFPDTGRGVVGEVEEERAESVGDTGG